jgi:hypothetical protein
MALILALILDFSPIFLCLLDSRCMDEALGFPGGANADPMRSWAWLLGNLEQLLKRTSGNLDIPLEKVKMLAGFLPKTSFVVF